MLHSSPDLQRTIPDVAKVDLLADFCKEELAAAQTYEKALTLAPLRRHADVLRRCFASHSNRAAELARRIEELGGEAPRAPGVWGSLVPTLATAAAAVSEALAIALLEEAEDRGVRRYQEHFEQLDPGSRQFVAERVVPAQDSTHAALSALKRSLES
jgi:hypothetical protein